MLCGPLMVSGWADAPSLRINATQSTLDLPRLYGTVAPMQLVSILVSNGEVPECQIITAVQKMPFEPAKGLVSE